MEANIVRFLASALVLLTAPAFADEVIATVLAYDRVDHVIVLDDKSVFTVPNAEIIPADLVAGNKITIVYDGGGENGIGPITSITI